MEHQVSAIVPPKVGRRMKPGRAVASHEAGIQYFFCYCDNCSSKILADREYLKQFMMFAAKQDQKLRVRLIKYLAKRLQVNDLN